MLPLVSIIIPTYNRANDLKRALGSVLCQTYTHWETLIIDNHSHDGTDEVVQNLHDPRIKLFKINNCGVIAASRNLGIKQAKGEYVAFLDSDDWWVPKKLEISVKYLKQGADIVYHDLYIVTKPKQVFLWRKARARCLESPVFSDLLSRGNAINNSSVVVKKEFLKAINFLSEDKDLVTAEDYDAWLKIAKLTEKFKKIPKTMGYYWAGGGNTSHPDRILKILSVIEKRYSEDFFDLRKKRKYSWLTYTRGRNQYLMRSYELAKQSFQHISLQKTPFTIYIKSRWMLFHINFFSRKIKA